MSRILGKLSVVIAVAGSCVAGTAQAGLVDLWAMSNAGDGNLWSIDVAGNTTTLTVNGGTVYYIKATQYKSTGSTATGLVGFRW